MNSKTYWKIYSAAVVIMILTLVGTLWLTTTLTADTKTYHHEINK